MVDTPKRLALMTGLGALALWTLSLWWYRSRSPESQALKLLCAEAPDAFVDYYGLDGYEVNYERAYACLTPRQPLSQAIRIMAYANGHGAPRDLEHAAELAALDSDASPAAQSARTRHLSARAARCAKAPPEDQGCAQAYDYSLHITSGRLSSLYRDIQQKLFEKERARALSVELIAQGGEGCESPSPPSIERYLYRYRQLGSDRLSLSQGERTLSLTIKGIDERLRAAPKVERLALLDSHTHSAVFPYTPPQIIYEGSGRYAKLRENWYALNGRLGSTYAFLVTDPQGRWLYLWDLDGVKDGDSVIAMDLKTGVTRVIGAKSYMSDLLSPEGESPQSRVDIPLELGGQQVDLKLVELMTGFGVRLNGSQAILQTVNPLTGATGACSLNPSDK